jgi:hypothetical protein
VCKGKVSTYGYVLVLPELARVPRIMRLGLEVVAPKTKEESRLSRGEVVAHLRGEVDNHLRREVDNHLRREVDTHLRGEVDSQLMREVPWIVRDDLHVMTRSTQYMM